jgi:hypothetical protein
MKTWFLVFLLACNGTNEKPATKTGSASAKHHSVVDDEVQRALVLDAALKKLEGEIAQMEADPNHDEAKLAEKRQMRQALVETLANTQRRIDELSGSAGARQ